MAVAPALAGILTAIEVSAAATVGLGTDRKCEVKLSFYH